MWGFNHRKWIGAAKLLWEWLVISEEVDRTQGGGMDRRINHPSTQHLKPCSQNLGWIVSLVLTFYPLVCHRLN